MRHHIRLQSFVPHDNVPDNSVESKTYTLTGGKIQIRSNQRLMKNGGQRNERVSGTAVQPIYVSEQRNSPDWKSYEGNM